MRCDLGYPIIVSPFAQFVMTQAVLNVMGKERYATVPDEVRKYVLGYYGEIAGPIDAEICSTASPRAPSRSRRGRATCWSRASRRSGASAARSVQTTICCSPRSIPIGEYKALKAAGPIKTDYPLASTPLLTLVKEIALRPRYQVVPFHPTAAGL